MHKVVGIAGLLALFLGMAVFAQSPGGVAAAGRRVAVVPVRDEISPGTETTLERRLKRALDDGAEVIIIEVNSFGGYLTSCQAACDMIMDVSRQHESVRTVACVKSKAISAAALISLACREIVMIDGSSIGDAQAVIRSKEGGMEVAAEKAQAMARGLARSVAQFNHYPEAVVLAMVDPEMEVYKVTYADKSVRYLTAEELHEAGESAPPGSRRVPGATPAAFGFAAAGGIVKKEPVVAKGQLLVLTSRDAERFGISSGTVKSVAAAVTRYGGAGAEAKRYELDWSEHMVEFLNRSVVSGLLMMGGLIALYVAVKTPGLGVPEVVGVCCFALFFFSKHLVGLAGVVELILFAVGFVLLAVEVFLIPGFGVVGLSGLACIMIALLLSLQKFGLPDPGLPETVEIFFTNLLVVLGSICGSAVVFLLLLRLLPATKFGRRLVLEAAETVESGYTVGSAEKRLLVGKTGVALTTLRPSGKAEIDGASVLVVTDGEFLDAGTLIVVEEVRGNRVRVVKA